MPRLDAFEKRRNTISAILKCRNKMMTKTSPIQPIRSPCSVIGGNDTMEPETTLSTIRNKHVIQERSSLIQPIRSSCSVIEDSDIEPETIPLSIRQKHANQGNTIIPSSASNCADDQLNTSMICLSRRHSFFTDNLSPEAKNDYEPKVTILSNVLIKQSDQKLLSPTPELNDENLPLLGHFADNIVVTQQPQIIDTKDISNISTNLQNEEITSPSCKSPIQEGRIEMPLLPVDTDAHHGSKHTSPETNTDSEVPNLELATNSNVIDKTIIERETLITNNEEDNQKLPRKRKRAVTKNIHMDFISEEEKEDFSSGSSNYWTHNESESSDDEHKQKSKKKKQRKENSKDKSDLMKKNKRVNKRKLTKERKNKGEAYETSIGNVVEAKVMKPNPCLPEKCQRGCYAITEERRTSLFNFFMTLDPQRQRDWLVKCARIVPIERKKTKLDLSKRQTTYKYYINDGDDHKQVCQKFLLQTLNITQKLLLYTVSKVNEGMAQNDRRRRTAPAKYTEETKSNVKTFIESLLAVPSHYCRKRTNKTYLPQEFKNITNLYRIYEKHCNDSSLDRVSEAVFRNIFTTEYNITFHQPKKDKCTLCVKFENNPNSNDETDLDKYKTHKIEKEASYERFSSHQKASTPVSTTITSSFDLQKVLNTPFGSSMLLYYSRKYAMYNFTIYESGSQNVFCYVWGESDGKRGSNEIGTCIYKYLEEIDKRPIQNVLLYCDSCAGQNKNKTILAVINNFIQNSNNIQVIQINYLLPGHTYMPVDSVHAVIERQTRKSTVWAPSQWPTIIETARKNPKPYRVDVLDYTDFINFDDLTTRTFTPEVSKQIKMREIRVATFRKKKINEMEIKYSMTGEAAKHIILLFGTPKATRGRGKGRGKGKNKDKGAETSDVDFGFMRPKSLYTQRLPISDAKYRDLKKLCDQGTIPRRFHSEYLALPCLSTTRDQLPETDEEDDCDNE